VEGKTAEGQKGGIEFAPLTKSWLRHQSCARAARGLAVQSTLVTKCSADAD